MVQSIYHLDVMKDHKLSDTQEAADEAIEKIASRKQIINTGSLQVSLLSPFRSSFTQMHHEWFVGQTQVYRLQNGYQPLLGRWWVSWPAGAVKAIWSSKLCNKNSGLLEEPPPLFMVNTYTVSINFVWSAFCTKQSCCLQIPVWGSKCTRILQVFV